MSLTVEAIYVNNYFTSREVRNNNKTDIKLFNFEQQDVPATPKGKFAKARQEAIKKGQLKYYPAKEKTFFSKSKPAYYEYTANGKEFLIQIKNKFGIKDKALQKFNPYYKNDDCKPSAGTIIRFYADDVM